MSSKLVKLIKKSFLYPSLKRISILKRNQALITYWKANGKQGHPPQAYKYAVIKAYARTHRISVLVETGTFYGDSLFANLKVFKKLFSIELDQTLFHTAQERFCRNRKVILLQGDSGEILGTLLATISEKCIFWLDGHYSEGETAKGALQTPIIKELQHIFDHQIQDHVILIDDARCFTGENDYPEITELQQFVHQQRPDFEFLVTDDIIRIFPQLSIKK